MGVNIFSDQKKYLYFYRKQLLWSVIVFLIFENMEWIEIREWYFINKKAEVKSFAKYKNWIIMSPIKIWRYLWIQFWRKEKRYLHRLMWEAFLWLDINDSRMCVCHDDDNPYNNNLDNLFLWTHLKNNLDCINKWRAKRKEVRVWCFWLDGKIKDVWNSAKEAMLVTWIDHSSIIKCCKWKLKTAWKLRWKYLPKKDSN